jgi:DNA-directed RNA polymerase specialized sigma24 family protein
MARTVEPGLQGGSDEDLMRRIQGDDVAAFEEFYDRYSARAFGLARAICGSSEPAEEALQEGFVALWLSEAAVPLTLLVGVRDPGSLR